MTTIYLTGAGPGDVGLLTIRGKELLEDADIVVYDYLVNPQLLEICKPGCELIYVGKKAGEHSMKQVDINALLLGLAGRAKTIVRLKGGDPFVFGRGGEEALALADAGIAFEIVPGVTAGIAAAAYAGIPVTHRDFGSTLTFISGHKAMEKNDSDIDWSLLARAKGTLVFYMGVSTLPEICRHLLTEGKCSDTQVALVRYGTWPMQEVLEGTLENISQTAMEQGFRAPALIIIGETVGLRSRLNWLDARPLAGLRVMVTGVGEEASKTARLLRNKGAIVEELSQLGLKKRTITEDIHSILMQIEHVGVLAFETVHAVDVFFKYAWNMKMDVRHVAGCYLVAMGNEVAESLKSWGLRSDALLLDLERPGEIDYQGRFDVLLKKKFIVLSDNVPSPEMLTYWQHIHSDVDVVSVHMSDMTDVDTNRLKRWFESPFDLVTFGNTGEVRDYIDLLNVCDMSHEISRTRGLIAGPYTRHLACKEGLSVMLHAESCLADAVELYAQKRMRGEPGDGRP